jgi:phosphoribosylformylglycinamidine synthase
MDYLIKMNVFLKKSVADPQGVTVTQTLGSLGYPQVSDVRVGKYFEISLKHDGSEKELKSVVKAMCEKLLINPVIEDYSFVWEVVEDKICA